MEAYRVCWGFVYIKKQNFVFYTYFLLDYDRGWPLHKLAVKNVSHEGRAKELKFLRSKNFNLRGPYRTVFGQ